MRFVFFIFISFNSLLFAQNIVFDVNNITDFEFPIGSEINELGFQEGPSEPIGPTDIEIDVFGNMYILDWQNYRIIKKTQNGEYFSVAIPFSCTDIQIDNDFLLTYNLNPLKFLLIKSTEIGFEIVFSSEEHEMNYQLEKPLGLIFIDKYIIGEMGVGEYWAIKVISTEDLEVEFIPSEDIIASLQGDHFYLLENGVLARNDQIITSSSGLVADAFKQPIRYIDQNGKRYNASGSFQGWDKDSNYYSLKYDSIFVFNPAGRLIAGMKVQDGLKTSLRIGVTPDGDILFFSSDRNSHKLQRIKRSW